MLAVEQFGHIKDPILLIDSDSDSWDIVAKVATRSGRNLLLAKTTSQAFTILSNQIRQLGIVIVDIDPGAHGLALLEAISGCAERPPMIVITALEETYMQPIAKQHGAAACLGKPMTIQKLEATIDNFSANWSLTCDRWGCLIPPPAERRLDVKESFRGITAKLSPVVGKKER